VPLLLLLLLLLLLAPGMLSTVKLDLADATFADFLLGGCKGAEDSHR
jgi:hypothetical protein